MNKEKVLKKLFYLALSFFAIWFFARGWWWFDHILSKFSIQSSFIFLLLAFFMIFLASSIGWFLKDRLLSIPLFVRMIVLPTILIALSLFPFLAFILWALIFGDDPVRSYFQHLIALFLGGLYLTACSLPGLLMYSATKKKLKFLAVPVGVGVLLIGAIFASYYLLGLDLKAKRAVKSNEELLKARQKLAQREEHLTALIGLKKTTRQDLIALKNKLCFPILLPTQMAFNPKYFSYTDPAKDRSLNAELKEARVAADWECPYQKVELEYSGGVKIEEFSETYDFDFRKDYESQKLVNEIGAWSWGEREAEINEGIIATHVIINGGQQLAFVWKQEKTYIIITYLRSIFSSQEILKMAQSMEKI